MYRVSATYIPEKGMFFDENHYRDVHISLASRQMRKAGVKYERIEVLFGETLLDDPEELTSPCIFAVYFRDKEGVNAFKQFRLSADVEPLRDDLPKYTNVSNKWCVSRVCNQ